MKKNNKMKFATKTIHAGVTPDLSSGAVMTPIFQTSTYVQDAPGKHKGFEYARTQNPTRNVLQDNLAALENGTHGICFGSGLAALDAILKLLSPGDEVISTNDLYGGSYRLMNQVFGRYGIKFHYIKQVVKSVKRKDILVCVDNTFASPYLQNPLDLGADIVMHSATKYLGGHSDVVHGAIVVKNQELADKLYFIQNAAGAVPGPQDCFLILRGIKTLHLRVQRACENAREIAAFLTKNRKIANVYYPGLKAHPNHKVAKAQMRDFGGMVSFDLKQNTKGAANKVLKKTELFALAESLGGVESLIGHPATMTHASIPKKERTKVGLTDSLIRLSVGVEDVEDLKKDLANALK